MATSQKIHNSNNDREQSKDELPNELTENLKNGINTHVISELSERLDALKKASGFDSLNQITAIREQFEALHKTSAFSIALGDLYNATDPDMLKKISVMRAVLDDLNRIAAIKERTISLQEVASKALLSFNLYPTKSSESNLKNINYPTSIEQALARDWQNVGNDLWKSCMTFSNNQPSDNDE